MAPSSLQIAIGIAVTILACIGCAYSLWWARRSGNLLAYPFAVGCAILAVGVVGQRAFPSLEATARHGDRAGTSVPGPWDAGVSVPIFGNRITPVAAGGTLLILIDGALLLLFERVEPRSYPPLAERPLDLDDLV